MVNYRTIRVVKPKYNGRLENKITGNVSGQCRKIKIRGMKFHDVFRECFENNPSTGTRINGICKVVVGQGLTIIYTLEQGRNIKVSI